MKTLASLRRGVYPQPIYEAHFSDGTTQRLTFFSEQGKPVDIARGHRLINTLTASPESTLFGKVMTHGFVDLNGIKREGSPDAIWPHMNHMKPKRVTAKLAKETLADLLGWLDGDGPDDALVRARELLAA